MDLWSNSFGTFRIRGFYGQHLIFEAKEGTEKLLTKYNGLRFMAKRKAIPITGTDGKAA